MSDKRLAQQQRKAVLQLDALTAVGVDAMVPGQGDLALGLAWVKEQAEAVGAPYTAANLLCDGEAPFPLSQAVDVQGVRVAVVGVLSPRDTVPDGCLVSAPEPAVSRALDTVGDTGLVVVLSRLTSEEDAALAEGEPRVDLIVGGGSQVARPTATLVGTDTARLELGTRGKKLGLATIDWTPGASGFRVDGAADAVEAQLNRVRARRESALAHHKRARDERSKERQQKRIEHYDKEIPRLEAELEVARSASSGPAHGIALELRGLNPDVADHPATAQKVQEALRDLEALEAQHRSGGPLRGPFMGSSACMGCHPSQGNQWRGSAHARAWQTLVDQRRQVDLDCYACHATGAFHEEGPSHPSEVGQLQNVGCEACHGPGRDHVRDPLTGPMVANPPEATCLQCHDGERDEGRFDFATYRPKVVHSATVDGGVVTPPPTE